MCVCLSLPENIILMGDFLLGFLLGFSHDCVCMIGYNESHGFEQKLEGM